MEVAEGAVEVGSPEVLLLDSLLRSVKGEEITGETGVGSSLIGSG